MKLTKRNKIIAEFIPVFLLIGYYLFPFQFLHFTQTILGKTALIMVIIFYAAFVDKLIGAAAALLFIFYYQTDFIENFSGEGAPDADADVDTDVDPSKAIESFENAISTKIENEAELIMPKQSNHVDTSAPAQSNPIGTPGVISEAFMPFSK